MADSGVGVTNAAPGAGIATMHTRQRTISATVYDEQYVIPINDRVISGSFISSSLRIPARAATSQTLAAIWNGSASTIVGIKAVLLDQETIVAKTVINPGVKMQRTSATHTNGTAGVKNFTDSAIDTSNASITVAFDAQADGTNSTSALVNGTLINSAFQPRFATRMHTLVGVSVSGADPLQLTRDLTETKPLALRPSQGLVVQWSAAAALTAGDWHWFVTFIVEEYTLP